jgi:hypothetical protein
VRQPSGLESNDITGNPPINGAPWLCRARPGCWPRLRCDTRSQVPTLGACSLLYRQNGQPVPGGPHVYPEMAPAGLWTTSSDLARYAIEVQKALAGKSNAVLSAAMAREMLKPGKNNGGLGVGTGGGAEHPYFTHARQRFRCSPNRRPCSSPRWLMPRLRFQGMTKGTRKPAYPSPEWPRHDGEAAGRRRSKKDHGMPRLHSTRGSRIKPQRPGARPQCGG